MSKLFAPSAAQLNTMIDSAITRSGEDIRQAKLSAILSAPINHESIFKNNDILDQINEFILDEDNPIELKQLALRQFDRIMGQEVYDYGDPGSVLDYIALSTQIGSVDN